MRAGSYVRGMRGDEEEKGELYAYVTLEEMVPRDHPLRLMRSVVDEVLKRMDGEFSRLYAKTGRPSIPPERLLRALLLQVFYSIRSERLLVEQLTYNMAFRWFVGLGINDRVWAATVFTKNRERLMDGEVARVFFETVLKQAKAWALTSNEHFTVDGTLIEAWASQKSFRPKSDPPGGGDGGTQGPADFRGETRTNDTHESTTDPQARLFRKGNGCEARLSYLGHLLVENRNGLIVNTRVTQATGRAEREAGVEMAGKISGCGRVTLGADKGYDTRDFVEDLRAHHVTPHVTQSTRNRRSAIDGRTTRHEGYQRSQAVRPRIERAFGWLKTIGPIRKVKLRGRAAVDFLFTMAAAAYNLVRIRNLIAEA